MFNLLLALFISIKKKQVTEEEHTFFLKNLLRLPEFNKWR